MQDIEPVGMDVLIGSTRTKAMAHVATVLEYGNLLCKFAQTHADFEHGTFLSICPTGQGLDEIENFAWGGGVGCDKGVARRLLISIASGPDRVFVVDDVMWDPSHLEDSSAVNDGQVFRWIVGQRTTEQEIESLVTTTQVSWHFLGIIFSMRSNVDVGKCLTGGNCAELGDIAEIVVGAYDGEGFIHWKPD